MAQEAISNNGRTPLIGRIAATNVPLRPKKQWVYSWLRHRDYHSTTYDDIRNEESVRLDRKLNARGHGHRW